MSNISVNTKLYFLLTHADGVVHSKEEEMGDKMMWHESMSKEKFNIQIEELSRQDREQIFEDCMKELVKFDENAQINCLAWMCLIANSDGFMDKDEWALIYRIYNKRLKLNLAEITKRQKELHKFIVQYRNIPDSAQNEPQAPKVQVVKSNNAPKSHDSDKPKLAFPM
jgi:uncharacterized tellurite resistance protein B-like protein